MVTANMREFSRVPAWELKTGWGHSKKQTDQGL